MLKSIVLIISINLRAKAQFQSFHIRVDKYSSDFKPGRNSDLVPSLKPQAQLDLRDIASVFGRQKCLVLLDNYLGIDIQQMDYPILLRKYVPGVIAAVEWDFRAFIWTTPSANFTNVNYTEIVSTGPSNCPLTKYHAGSPHWNGVRAFCIQFDHSELSASSKLWNCEAQFLLHIPIRQGKKDYLLHGRRWSKDFPHIFDRLGYRRISTPGMYYLPPSTIPTLHVFVHKSFDISEDIFRGMLSLAFPRRTVEGFPGLTHAQVIYVEVDIVVEAIIDLELQTVHAIGMICHCKTCRYYSMLIPVNLIDISSIDKIGCIEANDELYLGYYELATSNEDSVFDSFSYEIKKCSQVSHKRSKVYHTATDRLANAYAFEWMSIFKNYSYYLISPTETFECSWRGQTRIRQDSVPSFASFIHGKLYFREFCNALLNTVTVRDTLHDMKFVSCGDRGVDLLPFDELTNIYDWKVWFGVSVTAIVLSVLPALIGRASAMSMFDIIRNLESVVRILIGVDDNISGHLRNKQSVRIVIISFAYAALVLNNAYKSDNVLRIISPRNILPYETLNHLLADEYKVYTQVALVHVHESEHSQIGMWATDQHSRTVSSLHYDISIVSTLIVRLLDYYAFTKKHLSAELLDHLLFHPSTVETTHKIAEKADAAFADVSQRLNATRIKYLILNEDKKNLMVGLKDCEKTAVLLPGYVAGEYARGLQRYFSKREKHAGIGTEVFFTAYQGFDLHGYFPPYVVTRIRQIQAAYIFEWWQEFVNGSFKFVSEKSQPLKKITMTGNIVIIFVILLVGYGIGCVIFFLEVLPLLWARACPFIVWAYNISKRLTMKLFLGGKQIRIKSKEFAKIVLLFIIHKIELWILAKMQEPKTNYTAKSDKCI